MLEKRGNDLLIAPIAEGALVLAVAAIGWASHTPLVFTSLGPTVYELVEQPKSKTARVYNIFVGHMLAMGSGFFALWVLNAWNSPTVASAGFIA